MLGDVLLFLNFELATTIADQIDNPWATSRYLQPNRDGPLAWSDSVDDGSTQGRGRDRHAYKIAP